MDASKFEHYLKNANDIKNMASYWDQRAEKFAQSFEDLTDYRDQFLFDFLAQKKLLNPSYDVVDLCCAVGRHAVGFCKEMNTYTGADISAEMIRYCEQNKAKYHLDNAHFILGDWRKLEQKYDLVFASMCPAIDSLEAIDDFIGLSKRFCLMQRFVRDTDDLCPLFHVPHHHLGHNNKLYVYGLLNVLWSRGYIPEVQVIREQIQTTSTIDEILLFFQEALASCTKSEKEDILNQLKERSQDGVVQYTRYMDKTIIFWDKTFRI